MNLAVLFLLIRGSYHISQVFKGAWVRKGILALYIASFCLFEVYYFTEYQDSIQQLQITGAKDALEYAVELKEESGNDVIHVARRLRRSRVLFYLQYPTDLYLETVEWTDYAYGGVVAKHFGDFLWDAGEGYNKGIYVICSDEIDDFENAGYHITQFDACAVAYREE